MASADVNEILDRMALTCLQPGFVRFLVTKRFADAAKPQMTNGLLFGVAPIAVVPKQNAEVIAQWDVDSLPVNDLDQQ